MMLLQVSTTDNTALLSILSSGAVTIVVLLVRWVMTQIENQRQDRLASAKQAIQDKLDLEKSKLSEQREAAKESERRIEQQRLIDDSNTKWAISLREEMRQDRERAVTEARELRERLRASEARTASTEVRVDELGKINDGLRAENMKLSEEKGAQAKELELQAKQIGILTEQHNADSERITVLEHTVDELVSDRALLIEAMEMAHVEVPAEVRARSESEVLRTERTRKKPGTGPLTKIPDPESHKQGD